MTVLKAYADKKTTLVQAAGGAFLFQEDWVREKQKKKERVKTK